MTVSDRLFRALMRSVAAVCAVLLAAACLGCGGAGDAVPRAAVAGTVTLGGDPLPAGVVYFVPAGPAGGPKVGVPVTDGTFAVDDDHGPRVGPHRIEVRSTDDGGFAFDDESAPARLAASVTRRIERVAVPEIYTDDRSPLTAEVVAGGGNHWNFSLTGDNP